MLNATTNECLTCGDFLDEEDNCMGYCENGPSDEELDAADEFGYELFLEGWGDF